jgi:hypothetical protein
VNDKPRRRRRTSITEDPLAAAILAYWKEREGPHNMPLLATPNNAQNLADHLRASGFIKDNFLDLEDAVAKTAK